MSVQSFTSMTPRPGGVPAVRAARTVRPVPPDEPQNLAAAVDLVSAGSVLVLTEQEFRSGPVARQRYWARSHLGWQRMGSAAPNGGHRAIAALEHAGLVDLVITQNVDGLHTAAGSRRVIDLHGRIDEVICLDCAQITPRIDLHHRMSTLNPGFGRGTDVATAPDGDAELSDTATFRVPGCARCAGPLKPHVVFFGGSVARGVVADCFAAVEKSRCLLVTGSSLTVMSGFRFVRRAVQRGLPVVVINRGATRADPLPVLRLDAGCTPVMTAIAAALGAGRSD